jgi:hypothetical protein
MFWPEFSLHYYKILKKGRLNSQGELAPYSLKESETCVLSLELENPCRC